MVKPKENSLTRILSDELERRRQRNSRYSIRSFARDLQISARALTDVINNKRQLSRDNLMRVAAHLCMPTLESMPTRSQNPPYYQLHETEEQSIMSRWYNMAVFSLARTKSNRATPTWIARRLGITESQALSAVSRLCRFGLIEIRDNRMLVLKPNFETKTDIPSTVLRKFHGQNLKRAQMSLKRDSVQSRDMTSMTLAFAEKDMKRAKEYLWRFSEKFNKKFESMNGTDVYTLAIQFFPQTIPVSSTSHTNSNEDKRGGQIEFKNQSI